MRRVLLYLLASFIFVKWVNDNKFENIEGERSSIDFIDSRPGVTLIVLIRVASAVWTCLTILVYLGH
jgi:hypothetical protein